MTAIHLARRGGRSALLAVPLLAAPALGAEPQVRYDHAVVSDVRPIVEMRRVPVRRRVCEAHVAQAPVRLGDVRATDGAASLGDTLRAETRRRRGAGRCRVVQDFEVEDVVVAYKVTYHYGGDVFVRRMDRHPGDRVRVRVELRPMP